LYEQYLARNALLSRLLDVGDCEAALAELDNYLQTSERHVLADL
jgi:hypothetical protein